MTILGFLFAGAALGLGSFAVILALVASAPVDIGPRPSIIPRVDITA